MLTLALKLHAPLQQSLSLAQPCLPVGKQLTAPPAGGDGSAELARGHVPALLPAASTAQELQLPLQHMLLAAVHVAPGDRQPPVFAAPLEGGCKGSQSRVITREDEEIRSAFNRIPT